jgi:hypothetical protein
MVDRGDYRKIANRGYVHACLAEALSADRQALAKADEAHLSKK